MRAARWFSGAQLASSDRAHRCARQARLGGDLLDIAVPAALLLAGAGPRLAGPESGRAWVAGVVAVVVVGELAAWPLRAGLDARVELGPEARRRGADLSVGAFAGCFVALALLRLALSALAAVVAVAVIRRSSWWPLWLTALVACGAAVGAVVQARASVRMAALGGGHIAPAGVAARVRELAARAGLGEQVAASAWVAPARGSAGEGARLVGLGRHRRVILDWGVANGDPADLEVVVAHELGHWRHGHGAAALARTVVAAGLVLVALQALLRLVGVDPGAPESLPAVWLGAALLALPARLALSAASRRDELQADRFAAAILPGGTGRVANHLHRHLLRTGADLRPGRWDRLAGGHPPPAERLQALTPAARPPAMVGGG